jgi:hypothetical protein
LNPSPILFRQSQLSYRHLKRKFVPSSCRPGEASLLKCGSATIGTLRSLPHFRNKALPSLCVATALWAVKPFGRNEQNLPNLDSRNRRNFAATSSLYGASRSSPIRSILHILFAAANSSRGE